LKRFCSNCGNKINRDVKFCDKCGQKQDNELSNNGYVARNINTYNTAKPKKKKGCLISILLAICIPALVVALYMPESAKVPENIGVIMNQTGSNKDKSTQINSTLEQCGIKNIKEVTHDSVLDGAYGASEKGYRIKTDSINNIILYLREDNTVLSIKYADNILYDNNQVVSKLSDFTFTLSEESNLQINSQKMVKNSLKAPSTADFPNINEWKFQKDKEKIIIQSYVDSQNSFGAILRSEFQITLNPDGETVTSLIIDGKEYTNK
jgi:hypothetical protein